MKNIRIATVQFEHRSKEKKRNIAEIRRICGKAAEDGAEVVAFHECCISGYTIANSLTKNELFELAEFIPDGPSVQSLIDIADEFKITILAGLFEKDLNDQIFNSYICIDRNGVLAKHRKLHPFINQHLSAGDQYTVFEMNGWKCGILICYDNNVIENVRATNLLGADILFMPHVTMCTPSTRPGAGFVDPKLWLNRFEDPTTLREEFDGLKGRKWLMKWLPARAYDNAAYVIFSNPIGMDADQLKNGCSMIIDPFGDIIAECRELGNDYVIASVTPSKLKDAGGFRYKKARRSTLYSDILTKKHQPVQNVSWLEEKNE
ncbi:MAG: nitrilase family protein [Candidatus Paceibacterota bacterium]